ncbi:MAG: ABC transporter permease [Anaerolineales bacterium]
MAFFRPISANYFRSLGIPLLRGRGLAAQDTHAAPPVAVINETMARQFWPDENPIGQRFRTSPVFPWRTVVGIVGDVKHQGFATSSTPEMYFAYPQALWPQHEMTVLLRTAVDPASLAAAVRREVLAIDPDQPIYNARTMEQLVDNSLRGPRFNMLLLAIFAGLAVILAAVGIHGVMTYSVTQRTHELGIRMALGAQPGHVIGLVVRQGLALAFAGTAAGLAGAFAVTRVMNNSMTQ